MKLTAEFIYTVYAAGSMISIGCTSSAAVELSETVIAFFVGIYVAPFEFIAYLFVYYSVVYIAEQEFFIADKLMAWIEIS